MRSWPTPHWSFVRVTFQLACAAPCAAMKASMRAMLTSRVTCVFCCANALLRGIRTRKRCSIW
ncbi:UNVERIFIED_CONTAM: hypothetical protein GTU68_012931, partial [Idotea baltica]|nr:hypothetical protein [Idotea baltica]